MKFVKVLVTFLIIIQVTSGCVINKFGRTLNSHLNSSSSSLRREFGPPTFILENDSEGEVWVYSATFVSNQPGYINRLGDRVYYTFPSTVTYSKYTKFFVKNDYVYRYETNYNTKKPHWSFYIICPLCALIELSE